MPTGVEVTGYTTDRQQEVLPDEALAFLAELHRTAQDTRVDLLARRRQRREEIARTGTLDFLAETREIREGDWRVAEAPADLRDRRVEMTGPTDRKMTINALNSGAKVWLADFEDSHSPTWELVLGGQANLIDAQSGDGKLTFDSPEGKHYEVTADEQPTVVVRPRGWHLDEKHITVDGTPIAGGLVDFGLYFFHNAKALVERGSGPYYYLPKMESHLEARLWNDVFVKAQDLLGVPQGSVRATVLIETITAAFEMEEILYELRDHASGLNAGRWDYLFSVIKNFRSQGRDFVLPDRNSVGMTVPFMRAYSELLVRTCHKRGAFAIGGMAAFIPSRKDPEVNEQAMAKVHDDKSREAFTKVLGDRPNQLDKTREDVNVGAAELLDVKSTPGDCTEAGLRNDVSVGLQYIQSWLSGTGAAGIFNMMEDAATAEISRSQIWQWRANEIELDNGQQVTSEYVRSVVAEELDKIKNGVGEETFEKGRWQEARDVFESVALADDYVEFLTLPAYELID
jgi:malate synthase